MYPHDEVDCPRCGALPEGMILDDRRYELESCVGRGGKGRIYRAKMMHRRGKLCALKEMLPPQLSSGDPGTSTRARYERARQQFERAKELFKREAAVLDKLNHPYIPRVYGSFEERDRSYLVMDFIEGTSLQHIVDHSEDYLSQARVLEWVLQVCEVLDYLHSQKPQPIVHRDVKPANLVLTDWDGEEGIMLVDFGIARTYTGEKSHDTHHIATWNFAAPEQRRKIGLESSPQTDIYALGATLYYLLVNKGDEDETFLEVSQRDITGLPHICISPALEEVIRKACAWHPKDRFGSVREMREALAETCEEPVVEIEETRPLQCYRHPSRAADDVCDVCGKAICEECTTLRQGKCLCPDCAGEQETTELPWWEEEEESILGRLREPKVLIPLSVVAAIVVCAVLALAATVVVGPPPPTAAPIASSTDTPSDPIITIVSTSTLVPTPPVEPTSGGTKELSQATPVVVVPPTPTSIPVTPAPISTPFPNKPCFDTRFRHFKDIGGATQQVWGRVYNMNERPLEGALVEIYAKGHWSQVQKQAFTAGDGSFAFIGYPLSGNTDHCYILRVIRMPDGSPAYNTWEETCTFKFSTNHDRAVVDIWQVSFQPDLCHPPSEVQ